jgi:hypothetical protein
MECQQGDRYERDVCWSISIQPRHWPMGCQQCHGYGRDVLSSISIQQRHWSMGCEQCHGYGIHVLWSSERSRSEMELCDYLILAVCVTQSTPLSSRDRDTKRRGRRMCCMVNTVYLRWTTCCMVNTVYLRWTTCCMVNTVVVDNFGNK